jgi:class 3 adenylate cyclase
LQPTIERWLFPDRRALEESVHDLLEGLRTFESPTELVAGAAERIYELLRPQSCAIYVRAESGYQATYARGPAIPPLLAADHPIIGALKSRSEPLIAEKWSRVSGGSLRPFERAVLQTLDAALLFPAARNGELVAFATLGPKRTGDIYTKPEILLVRLVVSRVTLELARFDDSAILRQSQSIQEALSLYVPGAVAEEIAAGKALESVTREVAVMFVDIRGYTNYAQGRHAAEIFSTVNQYTALVSKAVRSHMGSVVEFNGDGMMAIFGAPKEIPSKEQAAVGAALEILQALPDLAIEGFGPSDRISVGIGIATGEAFVGSIRSADRLIWTAIGNTTNFASRLQNATRTFDADMVIDGSTWKQCGILARIFEKREGVRIVGRNGLFDVYVLPLAEVEARK